MSFWLQGMREDAESNGVVALASGQLLGYYLNALLHFSPRCAATDAGRDGLADVAQLPDFTARAFVEVILPLWVVGMSISLSNSRPFGPFGRRWRRRAHAFPADFDLADQASSEDRCLDGAITFRTKHRF
jgi:hypothetical protein